MGKLAVRALRAVLVVVLAGTVFIQALMVWTLVSGSDPEDGSLPLTPLRVITILGMVSVQVALVCVWRLVTMVRRGTVFSHAAFRYVDGVSVRLWRLPWCGSRSSMRFRVAGSMRIPRRVGTRSPRPDPCRHRACWRTHSSIGPLR